MADVLLSLARLRQFRATFNDDDQVDEESGLTAADLDNAIDALELINPNVIRVPMTDAK